MHPSLFLEQNAHHPMAALGENIPSGPRPCPALGRGITSQACGAKRLTEIQCPADCRFNPFASFNHAVVAAIQEGFRDKVIEYATRALGPRLCVPIAAMAYADDPASRDDPAPGFHQLVQYGLKHGRDAAGRPMLEGWRAEGFRGLSNDERFLAEAYGKACVTVVEVRRVRPGGEMEAVDLWSEPGRSMRVIDPDFARGSGRFDLVLCWFLPLLDHFLLVGPGPVRLPRDLFPGWENGVRSAFREAEERQPGLSFGEFLAGTYMTQARAIEKLWSAQRDAWLRQLDLSRSVARFRLEAPHARVLSALRGRLELKETEPQGGDGFDAPLQQFLWQRCEEADAVEPEPPSSMRDWCPDEVSGGLGLLRLYENRLVLETLSRRKLAFAKQQLEGWFGSQLQLELEAVDDLGKRMADRFAGNSSVAPVSTSPEASRLRMFASGSTGRGAEKVPTGRAEDPRLATAYLRERLESRYRGFLDAPQAELGNRTPREAAVQQEWRPQLIELMKQRVQGVEMQNRQRAAGFSLDWALEELGLTELL